MRVVFNPSIFEGELLVSGSIDSRGEFGGGFVESGMMVDRWITELAKTGRNITKEGGHPSTKSTLCNWDSSKLVPWLHGTFSISTMVKRSHDVWFMTLLKIHPRWFYSVPCPSAIQGCQNKESTPLKSNELTPKIAILKGSYLFQTIASPVGLCHENARPYLMVGSGYHKIIKQKCWTRWWVQTGKIQSNILGINVSFRECFFNDILLPSWEQIPSLLVILNDDFPPKVGYLILFTGGYIWLSSRTINST